ncbi:MAG: ROK family transcriptional regulator [Spirochaetota bacterium]
MFAKYSTIQKGRMNVILKSILNYKRITRSRLAEILKLSPSSIVKYIKILMEMGLIRETDREISTGGRRSIYLELNPEVGLNLAVVFNVSYVAGVLINMVGDVVGEHKVLSYQGIPKDELLSLLFEIIDNLLENAKAQRKKIFGIGLGLGGYIDPRQGISHEYLYARNWYDVPLKALVEERYGLPCFLVNDANACALGEKYYGMGVGVEHFLCVMMDEGVGMGIIVNGDIYMGKSYYAGEFGHTHVADNRQLCFCGHTGCLETLCSRQYIISVCREGLAQGVNSEILKYCENDPAKLTIEDVTKAANNGDRFARNIFDQVGKHLGSKLSDIANIFNPELIILRGPVIDGNKFLFESIERVVKHQSLRHIANSLTIVFSEEYKDVRFTGLSSVILIDYFSQ